MRYFTVIKRPSLSELKLKYEHTKDKQFYMRVDNEYPIEIILGDNPRFTRIPFGAKSSPFILGATLQYHYDQQPEELSETVQTLRDNTYVDSLMKTGSQIEEIRNLRVKSTEIVESAKFPVINGSQTSLR